MSNFLNTREPGENFSQAEFQAIERNADGDIIDLFDAYCFISPEQREQLTGDDQARMNDLDEELACEWALELECI